MYFERVLKYVFQYRKYFSLNILFSTLYAFFSAVAFLSLMPMLEVLFNGTNNELKRPTLELSNNLGDFIENWLNYQVTSFASNDNQKAIAEKVLNNVNERLSGKVVTKISLLKNYCPAEEYHQKYLEKK